jgi:putative Mn2+ efflux pump MntP
MRVTEVLFIALALAMDAFAVSIASGATMKKLEVRNAFKMGLFFGGFQTLMPVIGWFAGAGMKDYISGWDHWLAFGLLTFVGGKMIWEALRMKEAEECAAKDCPFDTGVLLLLSIATSIDALAVGITFSMLGVPIVMPVLVIGIVTFCLSAFGVRLGVKGGSYFENKIEILGGLILLAIGAKILFSHLTVS